MARLGVPPLAAGVAVTTPDARRLRADQQHHLAAIARAASSVSDSGSLDATLMALAKAVQAAAGLASAQVLILEDGGPLLRVVGRAGFTASDDFTARLEQCRRLGAEMQMLRAVEERRTIVVKNRKGQQLADPAWAPMHAILAGIDWDGFAAVPLMVRGRPVGVLIAFFPIGMDPDADSLEFLAAMADQAAMAVDYESLLFHSRAQARRSERERIARDLHDSVVQQVFSIRLQARALLDYAEAVPVGGVLDTHRVRAGAEELIELSRHSLADLRDLIFELRPADLAEHGLAEAVRAYASAVETRSRLTVRVDCPDGPLDLTADAQEDLYRIVQESLHNVVKHAGASAAWVCLEADPDDPGGVLLEVGDDGCGYAGGQLPPPGHLGLISMVERATAWGGTLEIDPSPQGGTRIRVRLPPHQVAGTTRDLVAGGQR